MFRQQDPKQWLRPQLDCTPVTKPCFLKTPKNFCEKNTTANWRNIHQRPKLAWCVSPCCQSSWWFASMFLGAHFGAPKSKMDVPRRGQCHTWPDAAGCCGDLWGIEILLKFWCIPMLKRIETLKILHGRGWDMIDMMGPQKRGSLALVKQWALYRFGLECPQFPQVWVSKINPRSAS